MKRIRVVIMDLDDTLWDWVGMWYQSFKAMLDRLATDSGIGVNVLLDDFRSVFQKHGSTEYAFAIEELSSLQKKHPGQDLADLYKDAIYDYRAARKKSLRLYPTVFETLERLRTKGVLLVGYTESRSFYTRYRLRKLEVDQLLNYLYSPPDHQFPDEIDIKTIRRYPPECYQLRGVIHRYTPLGKAKPSREILQEILSQIGVSKDQTIYVGDKLHKDVQMAKDAGVIDVWAKYGEAKDRKEYELLRQVTHWSKDAVKVEKETKPGDINPSYVLRDSFSELLEYFDFAPFVDNSTPENLQQVVEVWKKTVDVQQHFNDIELRIRNLAITVLVAGMGAAGFALKEKLAVSFAGILIPLASILLIAAAIGQLPLWFMDRHWYHRLLHGAVKHAMGIEYRYLHNLPEIRLSDTIKRESPLKILWWNVHTNGKLDMFYAIIVVILFIGAVIAFLCKPIPVPKPMDGNQSFIENRQVEGSMASRPLGIEDPNSKFSVE